MLEQLSALAAPDLSRLISEAEPFTSGFGISGLSLYTHNGYHLSLIRGWGAYADEGEVEVGVHDLDGHLLRMPHGDTVDGGVPVTHIPALVIWLASQPKGAIDMSTYPYAE